MSQPAPSRPLIGIFWMVVTGLCFVAVTALVKFMGPGMPAQQSAFIRYLLGLVFLLPLLRKMFADPITPVLWAQFGLRGALHSMGVALWFYAMTRIPIADVTAINYLAPIYVTIAAALFLGEKLAFRRITAVVMALVGALIILRPGFREVSSGHWAMMLAAVVFGGSYILAKITVDKANPEIVVGMLSVMVTVCLAPFAFAVWVPPDWSQILILFVVAFFATAGHYTMSIALAAAPVTVTQPVTFLQLVWAALLGVVVFAEPIDIWVVVGGTIILASVTFITWREAVLKRRVVTPPTPATKL
ncbi:MAG: DMT family transporter [Arenibacterium sp.]